MAGIPPPRDTDAEDVSWALQTAETQWKRNDREDALVWLRRAVLSAGEARHDDRMIELARSAVELAEELEQEKSDEVTQSAAPLMVDDADVESLPPSAKVPALASSPPEPVAPIPPAAKVPRELVRPAIRPLSVVTHRVVMPEQKSAASEPPRPRGRVPDADEPKTLAPATPAAATPAPAPHVRAAAPAAPAAASTPSSAPPAPGLAIRPSAQLAVPQAEARRPSVRPPAPDGGPKERARPVPASSRPAPRASVRPSHLPPLHVEHSTVITDPGEDEPTPVGHRSSAVGAPPAPVGAAPPAASNTPASAPPSAPSSVKAPPTAPSARAPASVPSSARPPASAPGRPAASPPPPGRPSSSGKAEETRPVPLVEQATSEAVLAQLESLSEHPATKEPNTPVHRSTHAPLAPPELDLGEVEAFADLPDDARDTFAAAAVQVHFNAGEEVAEFALAYVVEGEVDVASRTVPVTATHLKTGAVLRARGTPTEAEAIRLVCTTKTARIAVWSDDAVLAAFRSCPWVEDDLRAAADHVQALVGMTMGPLGRRLDEALRLQVSSLLAVRSLLEGEYVAEAGAAVPGIVVVGVGRLELIDNDRVVGELRAGEFLFPDQVLGAGAAPYGARAGAGGALVMSGNRKVAQELMVTCPPLLEILAGM